MMMHFKKDVEKLVTHKSGGHRTIIVYISVKKKTLKNVKAISGEEAIMQHLLIVMNILHKSACHEQKVQANGIKYED